MKPIPVETLIDRWKHDPQVKAEYDGMADEYAIAHELIAARTRAGLSQSEVAQRMGTTQSVVASTTNPCPSDDATWVRRVLVVRTLAGSTNGETQAPRAVACDVQAFQVRFGLDNDGDLSADEFRTATDLGTTQALWQRVVSVRVDFLVVNPKPNTRDSDQRYCLDYAGGSNPDSCPATAGATYAQVWTSNAANGRRAAKVFTTTFNFRNRTS